MSLLLRQEKILLELLHSHRLYPDLGRLILRYLWTPMDGLVLPSFSFGEIVSGNFFRPSYVWPFPLPTKIPLEDFMLFCSIQWGLSTVRDIPYGPNKVAALLLTDPLEAGRSNYFFCQNCDILEAFPHDHWCY